jgi:predicted PurR-regulated permease PerM
MPRIDWNRFLVVQLCLLAALVLLFIVWTAIQSVSHTLLTFVIAAILAFILSPLVERGQAQGLPRAAAVGLVFVSVAAILFLAAGLLYQPFFSQASQFATQAPRYLQELQQELDGLDAFLARFGLVGVADLLQAEVGHWVTSGSLLLVGDLLKLLSHLATSVVDTILVLVMSFYLLLDGPRILQTILGIVPAAHREKAVFVQDSLARVVGGYLRGQLTMAVTLGVVVGVGLQLLGVPYALVLAVLAGILELVPMFGPILAALPALAVAIFLPFPTVIWVLIFFIVIQQLENHVLMPRITGHAVGLHPLGAILALLAGLEMAGPLGAVFAVPIAGFLWVVGTTVYRRLSGLGEPAPRPPPLWLRRRRTDPQPESVVVQSPGGAERP